MPQTKQKANVLPLRVSRPTDADSRLFLRWIRSWVFEEKLRPVVDGVRASVVPMVMAIPLEGGPPRHMCASFSQGTAERFRS
jgi:hypothetical protein